MWKEQKRCGKGKIVVVWQPRLSVAIRRINPTPQRSLPEVPLLVLCISLLLLSVSFIHVAHSILICNLYEKSPQFWSIYAFLVNFVETNIGLWFRSLTDRDWEPDFNFADNKGVLAKSQKKTCDLLESRLNSLMLVLTERTKLLLGACCKLKYMVSEKEVGCDDVVHFSAYFYFVP